MKPHDTKTDRVCPAMDAKKFREKTVKVDSASNINLEDVYLDPRYTRQVPNPAPATPTGHLVIFRLNPNTPNLPSFEGRWDEKQNTIDVDLIDIKGTSRKKGFQGHRAKTVSEDPRVFKIDIQLPKFRVYEALLTLNVNWGVSIGSSMRPFEASLSAKRRSMESAE